MDDYMNYIVLNGRKAELTKEQLKALGIEMEKKNPFERVNNGETYYFIAKTGKVESSTEINYIMDNKLYNIANYCTDKEMLQQQAYRETLNRLLWRYSMEHGGSEIDWNDDCCKYRIAYNHDANGYEIYVNQTDWTIGASYFLTKGIAENAIKEIIEPFLQEHPDFKW